MITTITPGSKVILREDFATIESEVHISKVKIYIDPKKEYIVKKVLFNEGFKVIKNGVTIGTFLPIELEGFPEIQFLSEHFKEVKSIQLEEEKLLKLGLEPVTSQQIEKKKIKFKIFEKGEDEFQVAVIIIYDDGGEQLSFHVELSIGGQTKRLEHIKSFDQLKTLIAILAI